MRSFASSVAALAIFAACPALAQSSSTPAGNLEKLSGFRQTGTQENPFIPQTGAKADAIKKTLAKIKLPPGFQIGLYASFPTRATWRSARRAS